MHVRRDLKNSNSADPASNLKGIRISWSAVEERGGGGFIRYATTQNTEATKEHIERAQTASQVYLSKWHTIF